MPKEPCALEIDRLGVQFDGRRVLDDFSLTLHPGEKVALTGPSGSGKSTVLKCILGLIEPQSGAIRVLDRQVDRESVWEIRTRLGYVAQESHLGTGVVRAVLERPFVYKVNSALRGNLKRLPGLMECFRLPHHLLGKEMSTLSGGEKQRVALISALLLDRPILLLDEASSALDPENAQIITDFLKDDSERTVLSIAHHRDALDVSRRVVKMPGPDFTRSE